MGRGGAQNISAKNMVFNCRALGLVLVPSVGDGGAYLSSGVAPAQLLQTPARCLAVMAEAQNVLSWLEFGRDLDLKLVYQCEKPRRVIRTLCKSRKMPVDLRPDGA